MIKAILETEEGYHANMRTIREQLTETGKRYMFTWVADRICSVRHVIITDKYNVKLVKVAPCWLGIGDDFYLHFDALDEWESV